jgi:tetratricopeptide (TPR) repeat protein
MTRNSKFWISLAAFEIVFGLAIFAATRQYYLQEPWSGHAEPTAASGPVLPRSNTVTEADLARFNLLVPSQPISDDPVEIQLQANEFFDDNQYERAAVLYEKLLEIGPKDVNTYNNLGITLHYIGKSAEALEILKEGIAVDPTYQRIWLTLGFVNSQVGNHELARSALTNAVQIGTEERVSNSAKEMLESLPQ